MKIHPIKLAAQLYKDDYKPIIVSLINDQESFLAYNPNASKKRVWITKQIYNLMVRMNALRYTIEKDDVSLFLLLHGSFIVRPMKQSELFVDEKVLVSLEIDKDPFVYIYKLKDNIKEWWVNCGFDNTLDKAIQYELIKTLYTKQFLQLRT